MADDEAVFVEVWKQKWAKVASPQKLPAGGVVRRLYIGSLLGKTLPHGSAAGGKLVDGLFADLKSTLKSGAMFWSPAPGLIDIFYPNMLPQAADLSHSVLQSTIARRVHDMVIVPSREAALGQSVSEQQRHVDPEEFQRLCRKAQARPEQIPSIDVSELVLGKPDPDAHLSRRVWQIADTVLEDFLARGGYYTRQPDNQLLLLFPGLSASLARIKRNAIATEIDLLLKEAAGRNDLAGDENSSDGEAKTSSGASKMSVRISPEDAKENAQINQAFAALAASSDDKIARAGAADIPADTTFRRIPVWRAKNQTLVGHVVSANRPHGPGEISAETLDLANLARAQADIRDNMEAKSPRLVLTPLHWSTLDRLKTRAHYVELAAQLPEEGRRYLVFVLRGIPDDLMFARVDERLHEIRRYSRSISCWTSLDRRDFEQLRGLGLLAIGAELTPDGTPEREIMASMNQYLDALAPLATKSFIDGLDTKSLVIAALTAGFDYLSGKAIIDVTASTQGIQAFSIPDLYSSSK